MTQADIFAVGRELTGPPGADGKPGRVYTLRPPTQYEQGQFQRWLEGRAHAAVDRSDDGEERKLRRHHLVDVDAGLGEYEWDGALAMKAKWTPAGLAKVVTLVCADQGVDDESAEALVAHEIRRTCAAIILRGTSDPNSVRPVFEALGIRIETAETPSAASEPSSDSSSTRPSPAPSPNSADSPTTSSSSSTPSSEAPTG